MGAGNIGKGLLQFQMAENEAAAIEREAKFQQQQISFNKKIAKINAEDAITRGEGAVDVYKKQAAQVQGAQKAALAAQGIEIDSGSAAQIQYETEKQMITDVKTIKNNAWREAWGYKVEAINLSTESDLIGLSAKNRATSTLLKGGLEATESIVKGGASLAAPTPGKG